MLNYGVNRTMMLTMMLALANAVVRWGSGRVQDGRQLVPESDVDRARYHGIHRRDDGGRSCLHCRLRAVVLRCRGAVHLRLSASHVDQHLQQRSTQHLPLQPDKYTRLRDDRPPGEADEEMVRHYQTKTGQLSTLPLRTKVMI